MSTSSLLPYERFTLTTRLPLEEVKKRLSEKVDPNVMIMDAPYGTKSMSGKPYGGTVKPEGFEIFRIIFQKVFHLPIIRGTYEYYLGKTEVKVSIKPQKLGVFVFAGAMIGAWVFAFLPQFFMPGEFPIFFRFFAPVMIIIQFGRLLFLFRTEKKASTEFLINLLEAERVDG
jgi:hypothetical protein